jgi:hypothetical protein
MTFLFLRLSNVKIFPSAVIHPKNASLFEYSSKEMGNQQEWITHDKRTFKLPLLGRDPTYQRKKEVT